MNIMAEYITPGIVTIATGLLLWIFKRIPNDKIYSAVHKLFKRLGVTVTLGLSKWRWTAPVWNKTIEPWFIDLLDNTFVAALRGFVAGLRSDNEKQ